MGLCLLKHVGDQHNGSTCNKRRFRRNRWWLKFNKAVGVFVLFNNILVIRLMCATSVFIGPSNVTLLTLNLHVDRPLCVSHCCVIFELLSFRIWVSWHLFMSHVSGLFMTQLGPKEEEEGTITVPLFHLEQLTPSIWVMGAEVKFSHLLLCWQTRAFITSSCWQLLLWR